MLAYTDTGGDGPVAVLIHSGVTDRHSWKPVIDRLEGCRVVAPDLYGWGESVPPEEPYEHAKDVLALLDHLGVGRFTLAGNSFGGLVALDLASAAPDRIERLVAMAPLFPPGHEWSAEMEAFGNAEDDALEADDIEAAVQLNVDMWARRPEDRKLVETCQRRAFELQLNAPEPEDGELRVDVITAPTLVLVGEEDKRDFIEMAARLAASVRGADMRRLPGLGHLIPVEDPDAAAAAIRPPRAP